MPAADSAPPPPVLTLAQAQQLALACLVRIVQECPDETQARLAAIAILRLRDDAAPSGGSGGSDGTGGSPARALRARCTRPTESPRADPACDPPSELTSSRPEPSRTSSTPPRPRDPSTRDIHRLLSTLNRTLLAAAVVRPGIDRPSQQPSPRPTSDDG